jgi:uncharacterized protein with PQ loop repeat
MTMQPLESLAMAASVIMPLWNIPLVVKIVARRSSRDLSLFWVWGVWLCMLLMLPWAVITREPVLKVFSFVNFTLFSAVLVAVVRYRKERP